jgi:WD40 repeat protein
VFEQNLPLKWRLTPPNSGADSSFLTFSYDVNRVHRRADLIQTHSRALFPHCKRRIPFPAINRLGTNVGGHAQSNIVFQSLNYRGITYGLRLRHSSDDFLSHHGIKRPDPEDLVVGHSTACSSALERYAPFCFLTSLTAKRETRMQMSLAHFQLGHTESVVSLAVVESLDLILSGGPDCRLIVRRLSTGARMRVIERAHNDSILSIVTRGDRVATGSRDRVVKIWDLAQLATAACDPTANPPVPLLSTPLHFSAVHTMAMSDSHFATKYGDGTVRFWDLEASTCVRSIGCDPGNRMVALALSPDGSRIVTGSADRMARIFNIESGVLEACLVGHSEMVRTVCLTQGDGDWESQKIITGSYDGSVWVWARTGGLGQAQWEVEKKFEARDGLPNAKEDESITVRVFKVLSDGKRVFCATQNCGVVAWDL